MGESFKIFASRKIYTNFIDIIYCNKVLTMLSKSTLILGSNLARSGFQRNLATSYIALNKTATDPIQQIFVDSIKLYAQKKKAAGGKFVDGTKATEAALQADLIVWPRNLEVAKVWI